MSSRWLPQSAPQCRRRTVIAFICFRFCYTAIIVDTLRELAESFKVDERFAGAVSVDEPLASKTTMRVGGRAPLFLQPATEDALMYAVHILEAADARYVVLGGGSNVIMADEPRYAVISTRALHTVTVMGETDSASGTTTDATLRIQAGASWGRVIAVCKRHHFLGFESFAGLPGTVGGALYMNASCFGYSASDSLLNVRYYDVATGAVCRYECVASDWGYKRSPFQQGGKIVLEADFRMRRSDARTDEIAACYGKALQERAAKGHFSAPSAGSVFKNDSARGVIAGALIDECGLKGYTIGGAQIAPWHGNFIINTGGATADDIARLVAHVTETVRAQKGVTLEREILFVGD